MDDEKGYISNTANINKTMREYYEDCMPTHTKFRKNKISQKMYFIETNMMKCRR